MPSPHDPRSPFAEPFGQPQWPATSSHLPTPPKRGHWWIVGVIVGGVLLLSCGGCMALLGGGVLPAFDWFRIQPLEVLDAVRGGRLRMGRLTTGLDLFAALPCPANLSPNRRMPREVLAGNHAEWVQALHWLLEPICPHKGFSMSTTRIAVIRNAEATLYRLLGVDPKSTIADANGRPMYLLDDREPIAELLS